MGKTLLLLGGSQQQVIAIEKAKALGYRTVLCDYLPDNPGQRYADQFYQVSTTDRSEVLKVAKKENIDGVIAYSSDPASPTAGYVAEKMGLPTNPLCSIEIMSEKHLFRQFLHKNSIPAPRAISFSKEATPDEVKKLTSDFRYPIIIKPTDSSGSKGVKVVDKADEISSALKYANEHGRNGILIAEEYIKANYPNVIGGDIFVVDGEIRFWGLMDCIRDEGLGGLVPIGKRFPSMMTDRQRGKVEQELNRLVSALGIKFGELNVEIVLAENDVPYILELGSRAGGNMIPVQLSDISGIDLVAAGIECAMGEKPVFHCWSDEGKYYLTHVLHSERNGIYGGITFSSGFEENVYRAVEYLEKGERVYRFNGADKALGILFLKFDNKEEMDSFIAKPSNFISVEVSE